MGCDHLHSLPSSAEERCGELRKKLADAPLSCFKVSDFPNLHKLLVGDTVNYRRLIHDEEVLLRFEKIASEFRKGGAR